MEYTEKELECGCIIMGNSDRELDISYCPKHRAAPDLYEALRAAQAYIARKEMYSGVQDRTGLEVKIIKALSKAEGLQAEGK